MKYVSLLLIGVLALFFTSCKKINGEGPVITENRDVTGYSGIDLRISGRVRFTIDSVYKVEIHAQRNILDKVETYLLDNRLVIKFKNNFNLRAHEPIEVVVSGPTLNAIRVSGSGNVETTNAVTTDLLDLDVSGSGDIRMSTVTATDADLRISGSGDIKIGNGTIEEEKLRISGSGSIDLVNVAAVKATTTTSGSGDIHLNVSQQLNVTISGSGSVFYKGNPDIDSHISGSGKIIQL